MMHSPPSNSKNDDSPTGKAASSSFHLLNEAVQRWVWNEGWTGLRTVQERAIPVILADSRDVIITAPTAGGKTEAAFLPVCSLLYQEPPKGLGALYIGPLKALINDQFGRLEALCERLEIPVHRWHGDVSSARKHDILKDPRGILLITPESIEALFVLQGYRVRELFHDLRFIVLDELHAYMESERGRHLQSLLHRIEVAAGRRVRRIGLSATLGDMNVARDFLRPGGEKDVTVVSGGDGGTEVKVQVRGYVAPRGEFNKGDDAERVPLDSVAIARHLYKVLRGNNHLVFANSRRLVEQYADLLRAMSEEARVPNEFLPHHGSLSKELREDLEMRLRDGSLPTTAICTSTLELGIDIGRVTSIAQVGVPFSVSSLRQRLGRSGRRGGPAILRIYVSEPQERPGQSILDGLRVELVEAVAMVELLIAKWCEPAEGRALHLSTLVHQVLSLIAERGGVTAKEAWSILCQSGPFRSVDEARFIQLLRCMGEKDLLVQSSDGTLLHGVTGERIVGHFGFFAAFQSAEEYRVLVDGRELGAMPVQHGLAEGMHIIFAGRRWLVTAVESDRKAIHVQASLGGRLPAFQGTKAGLVHDRVRMEMRRVYNGGDIPKFLNATAMSLLQEARDSYLRLGLDEHFLLRDGDGALLFICRGDRILNTLAVQLAGRGMQAVVAGPAILIDSDPEAVTTVINEIHAAGTAVADELAQIVKTKQKEKFDWVLNESLLSAEYAVRDLDVEGAYEALWSNPNDLHDGGGSPSS